MTLCELRNDCPVLVSGLPSMPQLADFIRGKFCGGAFTRCPRHIKLHPPPLPLRRPAPKNGEISTITP